MKFKKIIAIVSVILLLAFIVMPISVSAGKFGPDMKADADSWDRGQGDPQNAIDMDESTIWHSLWDVPTAVAAGYEDAVSAQNKFPQILIVEFDGVYTLDCIGYLARPAAGGTNGIVTSYEFWATETGTIEDLHNDEGWTMIASGEWKANSQEFKDEVFKNVEFDAIKAKAIKLVVVKGAGGWASCAELQFGFTDVWYLPMDGFTPKTEPIPKPTEPETEPPPTEPETAAPDLIITEEDNAAVPTEAEAAEIEEGSKLNVPAITGIAAAIVFVGIIIIAGARRRKNKGAK